jgi:hypothetical protein
MSKSEEKGKLIVDGMDGDICSNDKGLLIGVGLPKSQFSTSLLRMYRA